MEIKKKIADYVDAIKKAYDESPFWGKGGDPDRHKFEIEFGRRFAKINHISWGSKGVHCFVEMATGNIWKAATFRAPQKNGIRGHIDDAKRPLFDSDFYLNR